MSAKRKAATATAMGADVPDAKRRKLPVSLYFRECMRHASRMDVEAMDRARVGEVSGF